MNKPSKAGESTREVRVAVACTGADGEPEMPIFIVPVTDAEFENGDHYGMAKEKAERYGYEEPFVCFDDRKQGPIRRAAAELASLKPVLEWTQQDTDQARAEGWDIFDAEGQLQIQRVDESPKNLTDSEAVHNAYINALGGSELHRKALILTLAESNVRKSSACLASAAADGDNSEALQTFTVFVQQADGRGTVHISAHEAATQDAAVRAAIADTLDDWDWMEEGEESVRVLGVAAGDVDILAWDDLDF